MEAEFRAPTPASRVGRGRGAGVCPWLEVDERKSEEGARLARPRSAYPGPLGLGGTPGRAPRSEGGQRGALRWPEGLSPDSGWRGSPPCAQCGSRSGSRARRLCEPSERARGARRAQESSVPASPRRWRTSSLSALATPPPPLWPPPFRARGSAYSRCPAPPTHPGLAAVTTLPARGVGAPLAPAALETSDIR